MPPCAFFRFRTKPEDECSAAEYEKPPTRPSRVRKKKIVEKKITNLLRNRLFTHSSNTKKIWQAHRISYCGLLQCLSVSLSPFHRKRVHKTHFTSRRIASMSPASLRRTRAPSTRSSEPSSRSLLHSPSALPQGAQGSPGAPDSSLRRAAFSSRRLRARESRSATRLSASRCAASRSSHAAMSDWRAKASFPR